MLVLSRQKDQVVTIGGEDIALLKLGDPERMLLERLCAAGDNLMAALQDGEELDALCRFLEGVRSAPCETIEVAVVAIRGDKVSLGIKAPRSVPVHRQEVYAAIKREAMKARAGTDQVLQDD